MARFFITSINLFPMMLCHLASRHPRVPHSERAPSLPNRGPLIAAKVPFFIISSNSDRNIMGL